MHNVFCIIGRTASGKSTIANAVAKDMNLKILKSYTTRAMRNGESEENSDHLFIQPEDVEKYIGHMVAYTDRVGYCSFATDEQLRDADIYLINPSGFIELMESTKDMEDIKLIDVWISVEGKELKKRGRLRGDYENWIANYHAETKEFSKFYDEINYTHIIDNNYNVNNAIKQLKEIISKENGISY